MKAMQWVGHPNVLAQASFVRVSHAGSCLWDRMRDSTFCTCVQTVDLGVGHHGTKMGGISIFERIAQCDATR